MNGINKKNPTGTIHESRIFSLILNRIKVTTDLVLIISVNELISPY